MPRTWSHKPLTSALHAACTVMVQPYYLFIHLSVAGRKRWQKSKPEWTTEGPKPVLLDLLIGFITATAERLVPREKKSLEVRPHNSVEWTALAACQIPLRVQNDNFCILSLREHIPVLLFSFALHARINTHPPTLKREAFEKLKSFADRSFSFIAPSAWNSLRPASLRNLPTLVYLHWNPSSRLSFSGMGLFINLGRRMWA